MDTESGRIFPPEVMARLGEAELESLVDARKAEELAAARLAQAEGRLVEVSETVAQKVKLGERELERRGRRRARARRS